MSPASKISAAFCQSVSIWARESDRMILPWASSGLTTYTQTRSPTFKEWRYSGSRRSRSLDDTNPSDLQAMSTMTSEEVMLTIVPSMISPRSGTTRENSSSRSSDIGWTYSSAVVPPSSGNAEIPCSSTLPLLISIPTVHIILALDVKSKVAYQIKKGRAKARIVLRKWHVARINIA